MFRFEIGRATPRSSLRRLGRALVLAKVAGLFACGALAQQAPPAKPVPPSGPLLKSAPEFSQWVMSFVYPQERSGNETASAQSGLPQKVVTTKTGNTIHEVTVQVSGEVSERWEKDEFLYVKPKGQTYWGVVNQSFSALNPGAGSAFEMIPKSGFRDLDWISKETYAGTIALGNQALLVFVPKGAEKLDLANAKDVRAVLAAQETVAFIDEKTRFPVSYRKAGVVRAYTFLAAPDSVQNMPGDLARQMQELEQRRARLNAAPKPEY